MAKTLPITPPQRTFEDGTWRVSAKIEGEPLWFECRDLKLTPKPEAFLTAFLIPALHSRAKLRIEAPVDPLWVKQTEEIISVYHRWWNYPSEHPLIPDCQPGDRNSQSNKDAGATALCFTGGGDSFYSLLRGSFRPNYLLYIHGYDIPLDDARRFKTFHRSLLQITKATKTCPVVLRTNLRQHSLFKQVSWERTHGAALAAAGMVLTNQIDTLVIPSSNSYKNAHPWGSHWQTDPFWGIPGQLKIVHGTNAITRTEKLFTIASEKLLQNHLRVCWENNNDTGNCSSCEKCLRTMVILEASGHLPDYHRVFNIQTPLPALLDELPWFSYNLKFIWDNLAGLNIPRSTHAAIGRLMERSARADRKKRMRDHFQPLKRVAHKIKLMVRQSAFGAADKP